jgi:hypothetical protein
MIIDVMLDLETLGTAPGSVITAIGAVATEGGKIDLKISVTDCLYYGLTVDPDTLSWWRKQSRSTWEEQTNGQSRLVPALALFSEWIGRLRQGPEGAATGARLRLWGDSASFDLTLLASAYRAAGLTPPWNYREECCYRTLRTVLKSDKPASKTAHGALSDAHAQLTHLQEMLKTLEGK